MNDNRPIPPVEENSQDQQQQITNAIISNNQQEYGASISNSNEREINTTNNMALQVSLDPVKYLNKLPTFNGDRNDLYNFIGLVDRVFPLLAKYDDMSQRIFFDIIKSRLTGKAREVIEINNSVTKWQETKTLFVQHFGDRLSVDQLFDELRFITFKTNCYDFYNEINAMLRRLNNKTKFENATGTETINNCNTALRIFQSKLPEPMRGLLYCRQPNSLEAAMQILYETGYAFTRVNVGRISSYNQNTNNKNNRNNYNNNRNDNLKCAKNPNTNNNHSHWRYQNQPNQKFEFPRFERYKQNYQNQTNTNTTNSKNQTVEPMDVDTSTLNRRNYNFEERQYDRNENFQLVASNIRSYPI